MAIIKNEIETPGFYYNDESKSLTIVEFELREADINKMNNALDLIEDLRNYFIGQEGKLATTLKHAMIVPFGFAKKQMGLPLENLIPYIYSISERAEAVRLPLPVLEHTFTANLIAKLILEDLNSIPFQESVLKYPNPHSD
ncbi:MULTISPECIES: hypothetical protein [Methanobrevibacter]|uniref:hypothetical protein n=1 Tax=Methanobrevibacter TaxID=2172 RepID=UPI00084CD28B|nr:MULTISPECIES: hypothetical protein [Methanobrevibacter]OEC98510.1 hypothetical protein A9505_04525 [Methanobrevibacter sp. A27]